MLFSLFCYYLLLASGVSVVSGFTPVTYLARVSSEYAGQYDPLQDEQLTEAISQLDLDCVFLKNRLVLSGDSSLLPAGYYVVIMFYKVY